MKIQHLLPFFLALVLLASCKKEEEPTQEPDLNPAKDIALVFGAYSDAFSQVDRVGKSEPGLRDNYGLPVCATVIFQDTLQFPYEVIIDFGEDNCPDIYGVNRRGKILFKISGPYQDVGTAITTTLENYHVMDHHLQGSRVVTNEGQNSNGNMWFSVVEADVTLTAPDGSWTSHWESTRVREWTEGEVSWWNLLDDIYEITGSAEGISRTGIPYTVNISDPLVVEIGCPWIVEGSIDLFPEGSSVMSVDYGNGNCDDDAVVIYEGNNYYFSMQ